MIDLAIKRNQTAPDLESFVSALPKVLGCGPWQEHESSNYPPDFRYFHCVSLGIQIEASIVDDTEFVRAGYDIQLFFKTEFPRRDDKFLADLADCAARKLAASGYEVLRPFDSSRDGKSGVLYRLDASRGGLMWERVVTRQIDNSDPSPA